MRISILFSDTFEGLLPKNILSYQNMIEQFFLKSKIDFEFIVYDVSRNEFPEKIDKNDVFLIPGSRAGAYEDVVWVKKLLDFVRKAYEKGCKILGFCFGHQLVAQALGGKVEKASVGWGVGVRTSLVVETSVLKYFSNGNMRLLYNHHDQVVVLPAYAKLISTTEFCPVESYMIGNQVLTFQGHPEYTSSYCEYLVKNHAQHEPLFVKKIALKSLAEFSVDNDKVLNFIIDFIC